VARWNNALLTNESMQALKRQAVLKEAMRAFGKRGYHNTSLDDIARSLDVSKGTLYNYIKDKQEILNECHSLAYDIGERAFDYGRQHGKTGAEILRHVMLHNIVSLTEEFGACAVLTEVDALRPKDRAKAVMRREAIQKQMIALINEGINDGSIRPVDPKMAAFTFMSVVNWLPRWYSPGGRLTGREIAEEITNLLMAALVNGDAHISPDTRRERTSPRKARR
jgi:AcrR family transcriptional regulator